MKSLHQGTQFLRELRHFIVFLQSLWGMLAGITVLFPLSNVFTDLIPLKTIEDPEGVLGFFSPALVTALATLVTLFVVFATFNRRRDLAGAAQRGRVRREAQLAFSLGLVALFLYLAVYAGIGPLFYEPNNVFYGDPRLLIGDVILATTYSAFFALVTRAFMLLAMLEYFAEP
jgi:hypothetical protein